VRAAALAACAAGARGASPSGHPFTPAGGLAPENMPVAYFQDQAVEASNAG